MFKSIKSNMTRTLNRTIQQHEKKKKKKNMVFMSDGW